jgi:hypothetical protein
MGKAATAGSEQSRVVELDNQEKRRNPPVRQLPRDDAEAERTNQNQEPNQWTEDTAAAAGSEQSRVVELDNQKKRRNPNEDKAATAGSEQSRVVKLDNQEKRHNPPE